jgi:hypothetical protein
MHNWLDRFMHSSLSTVFVLLIALGIFSVPVWTPLVRRKFMDWPASGMDVLLIGCGQFVLAILLILLGVFDVPLLTESRVLSSLVPLLCLSGSIVAIARNRSGWRLLSAILTLLMWIFVISAH